MNSLPIRIGIVFGGASGEHDVSIKSGRTIFEALKSGSNINKYRVTCFYIDKTGCWISPSISEEILLNNLYKHDIKGILSHHNKGFKRLPKEFDEIDIFFPILHGPNGEDGTIQGLFTLMGKTFVGSNVLGSALGMDKIAMKAAFHSAGIPQAPYISTYSYEISNKEKLLDLIKRIEKEINFPCFIKPANLGSSVGITKAFRREELLEGFNIALKFDQRIIIEKNIQGKELECAVLGKRTMKASKVGEISYDSDWYTYETKYSNNLSHSIIPAKLPGDITESIRSLSLLACRSIGVHGLARVDFFYNESSNEVFINEVNTLPGFTRQSMYPMLWIASGLTIEELVSQIIETSRE